ncbi:MAG: hypothetical protein Aurels2KO_24760 [Aureliella sp.]
MNTNRWFLGIAAVLSVNVLLVAASSIQAHMRPQEDDSLPSQPKGTSTTARPTTVADLSSPAELTVPSVPSLEEVPAEVPAEVKNDPVYQELKKMFSESGGSFETPPLIDPSNVPLPSSPPQSAAASKGVPNAAYFQRLDRRLESATQLCETARSIAAEAAYSAHEGDSKSAAELLRMATQLREMAANLISRQL